MTRIYNKDLKRLTALQKEVAGISPALARCYPVAIVVDGTILVYDVNPGGEYQFIKQISAPMAMPSGVRAAFQLADFGGRIACVVSQDVFDSCEGYVSLLHEFVHCYQYETCEQDIKMRLDIARKAQEVYDVMWEIEYPFPYRSKNFTREYVNFLSAIGKEDHITVRETRKRLRTYLGVHDYEYMVWQEWKEGFARWVENRVREHLDLPGNNKGLQQPFSRVLFYVGGAAYIDLLVKEQTSLIENLGSLFWEIFTFGTSKKAV
ncbi:MAG: hypothetical protein U9R53_02120 [Chloroflexota bacterium]|nr:hypothetical protein [Chloroflexota bacterium]